MIPYKEKPVVRKPGLWKGKTWMSKDFTDESEEINKMFYGEDDVSDGDIFPQK